MSKIWNYACQFGEQIFSFRLYIGTIHYKRYLVFENMTIFLLVFIVHIVYIQ